MPKVKAYGSWLIITKSTNKHSIEKKKKKGL